MKHRAVLLAIFGLLLLGFIFLERAILTPFILAAIFAYLFNPLVTGLSEKTKVNRLFFIILLYVLLFAIVGWGGTILTKQAFREAAELTRESQTLLANADNQIAALPPFVQDALRDAFASVREAFTIEPRNLLPIFSGAFSRVLATITFLFASFYFLKDGKRFIDNLLLLFAGEQKLELEILLRRINAVLGDYLRGQLAIVLLMAVFGLMLFTLLGVKFSLLLAITIGLAEIVPMIGPIIAGAVTVLVGTFDGVSRFGLPAGYDGLLILGAYVLLNQIENYLIVPQIMGKATKLHPLLVFFAVLAGGHLFGILGFILAVPVAATLRIVFEYLFDKLGTK